MRSKIFLAILLLTPLLVLLISTLSFQSGYSPQYTKNNGIFFTEYFDATQLNLIDDTENLKFEDGKWLFATYASKDAELEEALYAEILFYSNISFGSLVILKFIL